MRINIKKGEKINFIEQVEKTNLQKNIKRVLKL